MQGGLYLLAAEKQFGLEPVGMLYCGLRKDVEWGGWHAAIRGLERIGESSTKARLRDLIDAASATAVQTFDAIVSGTHRCRGPPIRINADGAISGISAAWNRAHAIREAGA